MINLNLVPGSTAVIKETNHTNIHEKYLALSQMICILMVLKIKEDISKFLERYRELVGKPCYLEISIKTLLAIIEEISSF